MIDDSQYPAIWTDEGGRVHVRCDRPGISAVSQMVGDGGPEAVLSFIRGLAFAAELEVDDSEDADGMGPITIGVPAGG